MAYKCPHCAEAIEGVLTQEAHRERLAAKDEETKSVKEALKTAQAKATKFDEIEKEHGQLKAELTKRDQVAERTAAFEEAQIPTAVRKGFEIVYNSAVAGMEEPTAFAEWLASEETKADPMLAGHFGKGNPAQSPNGVEQKRTSDTKIAPVNGAEKKTQAKGGLMHVDAGSGDPPQNGGIKSPEDLQAWFNSPEYKAMKPEDRRVALDKAKATYSNPRT